MNPRLVAVGFLTLSIAFSGAAAAASVANTTMTADQNASATVVDNSTVVIDSEAVDAELTNRSISVDAATDLITVSVDANSSGGEGTVESAALDNDTADAANAGLCTSGLDDEEAPTTVDVNGSDNSATVTFDNGTTETDSTEEPARASSAAAAPDSNPSNEIGRLPVQDRVSDCAESE